MQPPRMKAMRAKPQPVLLYMATSAFFQVLDEPTDSVPATAPSGGQTQRPAPPAGRAGAGVGGRGGRGRYGVPAGSSSGGGPAGRDLRLRAALLRRSSRTGRFQRARHEDAV